MRITLWSTVSLVVTRVDVDFRAAQRVTNPGQRSGPVIQEKSKLRSDLHRSPVR